VSRAAHLFDDDKKFHGTAKLDVALVPFFYFLESIAAIAVELEIYHSPCGNVVSQFHRSLPPFFAARCEGHGESVGLVWKCLPLVTVFRCGLLTQSQIEGDFLGGQRVAVVGRHHQEAGSRRVVVSVGEVGFFLGEVVVLEASRSVGGLQNLLW
jgi:hypothetical protein